MTLEKLLNKARKDAKNKVYLDYLEICEGNEKETKEFIEYEKNEGLYYRYIRHETLSNFYKLIKVIRETELMTENEKDLAIAEIYKTPEYQETKHRVLHLFANHFVKYKDVYLK